MHQRTRSPLESLNISLHKLTSDNKMAVFHFHLSQEAKRQRIQDKIIATHAGIEKYSAGYLKSWQFLKLKIDASEVHLNSKDIIKFRPCFFSPLSTDTVRICLSKQLCKDTSNGGSFGYAGRGNTPSSTATQCPLILDLFREKYATSVRKGFCLDSLTTLRECGATSKGKWKQQPGLELVEKISTERWQILRILEDLEHEVPHAVCDIRQNIQVDKTKGLTVAEVKAIMRVMAVRIGLDCYRRHSIMPILAISYLNRKQGRILQAHHNGKRVVIQYTKVLELDGLEHHPIELFLRYYCSQPVGKTANKQKDLSSR
ncbi:uncharacterized protein BO88DRAFT_432783 [Aspergillus vadensis CBS 113365]|uniref:Uncharacterized protein n=1 Tax=Aspergillus vadensis (strain CBS 113365 / IMI 142717 / IBT 24658) TaxID=1448311 RepID=A0A319C418_ASPVC|nr:hypothetical protein BO88DRAFT_432783 [Aspergillus vadensis CBS 113365]PYH73003.1 hypothetical protein BO88DRAFT_432783 [Aspergillus vadensis CBS 113365]